MRYIHVCMLYFVVNEELIDPTIGIALHVIHRVFQTIVQ